MANHIEELRSLLACFVASLTDGGRLRENHLSINHDQLRDLVKRAQAAVINLTPTDSAYQHQAGEAFAVPPAYSLATDILEMVRTEGLNVSRAQEIAEKYLAQHQASGLVGSEEAARELDEPEAFEAWWDGSTYRNPRLIGYGDKKCLAFAAFSAGAARFAQQSAKTSEGEA